MKHTYIVVILLLALGASSCRTFKKNKKNDDDFYDFKSNQPTATTQPSTENPSSTYETAPDGTYTKPEEVTSRFEKVEIVRGAIDQNAKYFIILGSFSIEDNANRFVEKLATQGFAPNILRSETGLYRVSGYFFNNENDARSEVAQIREKHPEYSDLWLLIKK